jgi:hypothetical protein
MIHYVSVVIKEVAVSSNQENIPTRAGTFLCRGDTQLETQFDKKEELCHATGQQFA